MNVTLCSIFRNSVAYIRRYTEQVRAMAAALADRNDRLNCIWGEGDSTDDTLRCLRFAKYDFSDFLARSPNVYVPVSIIDCTHGGKEYGSIIDSERFKQLAGAWNKIIAAIPKGSDVVLACESDLLWTAEALMGLIGALESVPMIAPMVMLKREGYSADSFYDLWAFRKDGQHFKQRPPYFNGWPVTGLVQVDSVGSCWAMRAELARSVSFPEHDVVVGLCREVYEKGGSVWLNTALSVEHD